MSDFVTKITEQNFESFIKQNPKVLIDFWASWCGPCRMTAPELEAFAEAHKDIAVGKINVDEEGKLATAFMISSIPTLVFMENGVVTQKSVGAMTKTQMELKFLSKH